MTPPNLLKWFACLLLFPILAILHASALATDQASEREQVLDIFFADQQHGWVLTWSGKHNRAFRTQDGGDSWSEVAIPYGMYKLFFGDSHFGWGLSVDTDTPSGNMYSLFHTLDGGLHWTQTPMSIPESMQPLVISDFLFIDPKYGWLVGNGSSGGVVFSTADGGNTWQKSNPISRLPELNRLRALPKGVWIFGENIIIATFDKGKTWDVQLQTGHKAADEIVLRGGCMLPDGAGWAAGNSHGPVVLQTSNFGKTWHLALRPPEEGWFDDVDFAATARGCVSGKSTALYCTTDRGKSWSRRYVPITREPDPQGYYNFTRVLFSSIDRAWLIAEDGSLARSNDGGQSWNLVALPTDASRQISNP